MRQAGGRQAAAGARHGRRGGHGDGGPVTPKQTMEDVKINVAKAITLDIPHMSLYSLILENHTVFMNRMRRGKLPLPKEELQCSERV